MYSKPNTLQHVLEHTSKTLVKTVMLTRVLLVQMDASSEHDLHVRQGTSNFEN